MTIYRRHKKTQKMKSDTFLHTNRSEEIREMSKNMQNKPNLLNTQINVTKVLTKAYDKRTLGGRGKNKPNSNPIKAN